MAKILNITPSLRHSVITIMRGHKSKKALKSLTYFSKLGRGRLTLVRNFWIHYPTWNGFTYQPSKSTRSAALSGPYSIIYQYTVSSNDWWRILGLENLGRWDPLDSPLFYHTHWAHVTGLVRHILHEAHHVEDPVKVSFILDTCSLARSTSIKGHHLHHGAHAAMLGDTDLLKIKCTPEEVHAWSTKAASHIETIQKSWYKHLEDAQRLGKMDHVIDHYMKHLPNLRAWAISNKHHINFKFLMGVIEAISLYDRFLVRILYLSRTPSTC